MFDVEQATRGSVLKLNLKCSVSARRTSVPSVQRLRLSRFGRKDMFLSPFLFQYDGRSFQRTTAIPLSTRYIVQAKRCPY